MAHIFISYSTRNSEYAYRLAEQLQAKGFDVWIDNAQLRSGSNWWESIVLALRDCAAFIVIMSPEARQSKWVQREVTLADNWNKPTFPLLMAGQNWEIFVLTQFRNVSDGSLPPERFYTDLAMHTPRRSEGGSIVTTTATLPDDDDDTTTIEEIRNPPPPEEISDKPSRTFILLASVMIAVFLTVLAGIVFLVSNNREPTDLELTPLPEVTNERIAQLGQQTATAAVFFVQTETAQAIPTAKQTDTPIAISTLEPPPTTIRPTSDQDSILYPSPLENYRVSQPYSPDQGSQALVLFTDLDEPIYSGPRGGKVLDAEFEEYRSDMGLRAYVRIVYSYSTLPTRTQQMLIEQDLEGADVACTYSHLSTFTVQRDQVLYRAQQIGKAGSVKSTSSSLLRLECQAANGRYVFDPTILFDL